MPPKSIIGASDGNKVPGTYLKTQTGVTRGEELFCRPDMLRSWRSSGTQHFSTVVAAKEKEIEELLRKCSDLRTQLGAARNDARCIEFSVTEEAKAKMGAYQQEIQELNDKLKKKDLELSNMKELSEHQIRLVKSQIEGDAAQYQANARIAVEKCVELAKTYTQQVDDIKQASAREVQFIENLYNTKVLELTAELKAEKETSKMKEAHFNEKAAAANIHASRIGTEFKERLRDSESRVDAMRKKFEKDVQDLTQQKKMAEDQSNRVAERLAAALADKDEVLQRYKQWNNYILSALDRFYNTFVQELPELAVEPTYSEIKQIPQNYVPRLVLEDPEAKISAERIAYRLSQILQVKTFTDRAGSNAVDAKIQATTLPSVSMDPIHERQDRLRKALKEVESRQADTDAVLSSILRRLYFFSDNLENAVQNAPSVVAPPLKNVIFVCTCVSGGNTLWLEEPELMRTSVTLLNSTLRLKLAEYGAYECYSDDMTMLLAFKDPIAACRFCLEGQEWLIRVPWPSGLSSKSACADQYGGDGRLIFKGLRVCMSIHTGEAFVEATGVPLGGKTYRCHYYGRAVAQTLHICSLTQGGQIIISNAAWSLCASNCHELGKITTRNAGTFPILSFNSETGNQEKEPVALLELVPSSLADRQFKPSAQIVIPSISALSGLRKSILQTEVNVLEDRRQSLRDAVLLIREEETSLAKEIGGVMEKFKISKGHFHLLPPPEMVTQMNELYEIMERVASRAEGLRADMRSLDYTQDEIDLQCKVLKEYFAQQMASSSREDELRAEIDIAYQRADLSASELQQKYVTEISRLRSSLQEKEQIIRKMYQKMAADSFSTTSIANPNLSTQSTSLKHSTKPGQ